jgi:excinuclease ABC subunit B
MTHRTRQVAWNEAHGITPQTIRKAVRNAMDAVFGEVAEAQGRRLGKGGARLTPEQALKQARKLEQEMYRLARNLEFEEAARVRDQIAELRRAALGPEADRRAG